MCGDAVLQHQLGGLEARQRAVEPGVLAQRLLHLRLEQQVAHLRCNTAGASRRTAPSSDRGPGYSIQHSGARHGSGITISLSLYLENDNAIFGEYYFRKIITLL